MAIEVQNIYIRKDDEWKKLEGAKYRKDGTWVSFKGVYYQGTWYVVKESVRTVDFGIEIEGLEYFGSLENADAGTMTIYIE